MKQPLKLQNQSLHIRDPIHGSIPVSGKEIALMEHPAFARLRYIKQLGFTDLAFPGATHSRFSHSIGAMHLATRVFDQLLMNADLPDATLKRFRQTVRIAMLVHDIGHAPFSHTTETLMPALSELSLKTYQLGDANRRATHEDYTLKIITDSSFSKSLFDLFSDDGITISQIAELIDDRVPGTGDFSYCGINYAPALRQIVTSECDADRMDYLQRDSFYCGVNYGKFDADWLIDSVVPVQKDQSIFMGIKSSAIFSFEDFLLSRYHMFASVYLHHTPVIFEKMLQKCMREESADFLISADVEQYIQQDDLDMWHALRTSQNPWARRIVERKPYYLLHECQLETPTSASGINFSSLEEELISKKVDYIKTHSRSILSKYFGLGAIPIYVTTKSGQVFSLEDYTPLFQRYKNPAVFSRLYVNPEKKEDAMKILTAFIGERNTNGT